MSSPKKHVPKLYEVRLKHEASAEQVERLLAGVVLDDDPVPVRAAACHLVEATLLHLTLTEGKYHQVKRMVAAVGNRVESLHRSMIGGLRLPSDLAPGQWRWSCSADRAHGPCRLCARQPREQDPAVERGRIPLSEAPVGK